MNITSWTRLRYMMADSDGPLEDSYANKRKYIPLISGISNSIEQHLNRDLQISSRTQYFDVVISQREFFPRAYPITTLTSVYSDSRGLYDGNEILEINPHIGKNDESIVLDTAVTPGLKALQIIYTGGLASHGTQSQFTLSNEGDTALVADNFVEGQSSGAMGIVISKVSTAITIEMLYGVYEVGETVQGKDTEDGDSITDATAVLSSRDVTSLAEGYPDIVEACEIELAYMQRHRFDLENQSTLEGQTSRRDFTKDYNLLPEVRGMLEKYIHFPL